MNDIEHNFIDTVSTKRILQWKATVEELISIGFGVESLLDHLWEIASALFMKKVQPAVEVIDAHIESLKTEVADLEARCERFLFGATSSNCFEDQTLISDFWLDTYSLCSFIFFPCVYFFPTLYTSHF